MDMLYNGFNWVDLVFVLLVIYFVITSHGLVDTLLDLAGFVFAMIFSYKFYVFFGRVLITYLTFPHGLANAIGFFIAWAVAEMILSILISLIFSRFLRSLQNN